MADVFISYKRDERGAVEQIAARLRALGLQVWFDAGLSAGESFNTEIDREARAATAILICWSPAAKESDWVIAEALIGFTQKKLAACYVAGPDAFEPPAPFNAIHAEDMRAWLAAPTDAHSGWKSILRRIGKLCARPDIESYGALDVQASAAELHAWINAHHASPLFVAVEALLRGREAEEAERGRLEQEARERHAREEAARRAREAAERRAREEREAEARALQELERRRAQEAAAQREAAERQLRERDGERARRRAAPGLALWLGAGAVLIALLVWQPWRAPSPPAEEVASNSEPEGGRAGGTAESGAPAPGPAQADLPEMVRIPGGSFVMGSPDSEPGRDGNEGPQRSVRIASFYLSRTEVTFAQWDACVAGGGCGGYRPEDQGWGRGDQPVINVSWNDVQSYLTWINGRVGGQRFRLPSEAEWEYAARSGTSTAYPWGASASHERANYGADACCSGLASGSDRWVNTAPVGSFPANAFGLHDMHGNVLEWVQDCYAASYAGLPSDGSASETSCANRVYRGGSWYNAPSRLRSAGRGRYGPSDRFSNLGFRLARTL